MSKLAEASSIQTRKICEMAPVIPVITIDRIEDAVPLAKALVGGGLPVLEVTLRTPVALDAIRAMKAVSGSVVGAGTVLTEVDAIAAREAGAKFAVSPGSSQGVMDACEAAKLPLLPGTSTPTEVMTCLERGYSMLKFFPAEANGGASVLKAWQAPLPQAAFCPTGGVSPANASQYLSLENVVCVGGSWVMPKEYVARGNWGLIEELAKTASKLSR